MAQGRARTRTHACAGTGIVGTGVGVKRSRVKGLVVRGLKGDDQKCCIRLGAKCIKVKSLEVSGHVDVSRDMDVRGKINGVRCLNLRSRGSRHGLAPEQSGQIAHLMNWLYRPAVL